MTRRNAALITHSLTPSTKIKVINPRRGAIGTLRISVTVIITDILKRVSLRSNMGKPKNTCTTANKKQA